MSPVTQQLLTLAGVLVGAGATFSATTLIERAKWKRGLDTRWDDKRLAAYIEYANALKESLNICMRLAEANGYPAGVQPIDRDAGIQAWVAADTERTTKWEAVLLLGSAEGIAAARQWHKAVWRFRYFVVGTNVDHEEYLRSFETMGRLRNQFYACARADLGVKRGALPEEFGAWMPPGYSLPSPGSANDE